MRLRAEWAILGVTACHASTAAQHDPLEVDEATPPPHDRPGADATAAQVTLAPATSMCPIFSDGREAGRISDESIVEASGVVASAVHAALWVHNDSGDRPRLFALDYAGALLGTYELATADAVDWEDVAVGPGPRKGLSYLYVGDIGDNVEARDHVVVYRTPEPEQIRPGPTVLDDVETIELRYPAHPSNAEALMVDPVAGDLYVVSKSWDNARVFVARAPVESSARLEEVVALDIGPRLPAGLITGGDISADGAEILLRTPTTAMLFPRSPSEPLVAAFERPACLVPLQPELQGEAIAFLDSAYVTVSEGLQQPVWRFDRMAPASLLATFEEN